MAARRDEGGLKAVGWGPFGVLGRRRRRGDAEDGRLAEVASMRQSTPASAAEVRDEPSVPLGKQFGPSVVQVKTAPERALIASSGGAGKAILSVADYMDNPMIYPGVDRIYNLPS